MKTRHIVTGACVASVLVLALFQQTSAFGIPDKMAFLTFSQPVSLPGLSLGAGTYRFEVVNPTTSGDVVRVSSRDGKMGYYMGFTQRVSRPAGLRDDAVVSLGEAAPGTAPAITIWWHSDGGHEFIYNKR